MTETTAHTPAANKAIVLEAFETLFNRKDIAAARRFWSSDYVQHSAHVPAGREGLFGLVANGSPDLRYENQLAVAEGDHVMLHGRFTGLGLPANWVVVDILRLKDGVMVEHWDVIQDEATRAGSLGGHPMFGDHFPDEGETL
ncbi:ester cyclase [Sphingobium sp. EM0848]|uniref:nuclear transport factor 2 family protein n=1 Tax=Sphingobium sp. EM0848 TaxID=2743473 RepID=UPI00159C351F|nr:ester cyclase [Sphingobium sp. EM0848]